MVVDIGCYFVVVYFRLSFFFKYNILIYSNKVLYIFFFFFRYSFDILFGFS